MKKNYAKYFLKMAPYFTLSLETKTSFKNKVKLNKCQSLYMYFSFNKVKYKYKQGET